MTHKERTLANSPAGRELLSFLTTEEVLGYLKVTPRTIYRLIRTGELPAVRIGRQWRFRRGDLDSWLDRQRHSASS
jgi:excisionase family DNA binding protein